MFLVVVMVVGVSPSLGVPHNPYGLTHQEMSASILINQLAILKNMNEPTSYFASHEDELSQLQKDMNEVNDKIEGMNGTLQTGITKLSETMKNEIQRLNDTGEDKARAINEMNTKIQSMDRTTLREARELGEQMETEINNKIDAINQTVQRWMDEMNEKRMNDTQRIMEKLEAVQNAAAVHHHLPNPADLYVRHNDTYDSICDGHKVLYGGRGVLIVTSNTKYNNNLDCSWTVTLPEGSRPVFRWDYFDIKYLGGGGCSDYMSVRDFHHDSGEHYCGQRPDGSYLTVMSNKFVVTFHSDSAVTGRGFKLKYRAVEN